MPISPERAESARGVGVDDLLAERRWLYASRWERVAIGLVVAALAIFAKALSESVAFETFYLLLVPAVVGAGVLGGFAGGAVTTVVIALAVPIVDPPLTLGTDDSADVRRLALFVLDGLVISAVTDALRRTLANVERSRLAAVESQRQARLLQRLAAELATESHQRQIAETVLGVSLPLVGASRAGIIVRGADGTHVLAALGYSSPAAATLEALTARTPVATNWVIDHGLDVWLEDLKGAEARFLELDDDVLTAAEALALAAFPLQARGGSTFGVLFYTWPKPRSIPEADRRLFQSLAALAAQALDRARLYEEQADRVAELARREEVREAFLAVLSHELRTPVTTIVSAASILARDASDRRHPDLILDVRDEADRLWRIVDDLLVLSRSERGVIELTPEPLLLQRLVPELVEQVSRKHPGVTFNATVGPLPAVMAERTALRQVLHNLLTNAAKYAGAAGPIDIKTSVHEGFVHIAVLDRGPGVGRDPDALFGLFYRSPETSHVAAGTGIGLYVARALVNAMGGTIVAGSRRGGGARFRFTLPLAVEDEDILAAPTLEPVLATGTEMRPA